MDDLLTRKPGILEDVARAFSDPRCMPACGEFAGVVQQAVLKARDAVEAAWYTRLTDPAYEKLLGRERRPAGCQLSGGRWHDGLDRQPGVV